jgi:uncharacterized protein YmfQ (DUF2313 family)
MNQLGYGKYPYGAQPYKYEATDPETRLHYFALRQINPLKAIEDDPVWDDEVDLEGKHLDNAYFQARTLLQEMFGDTAELLLSSWERVYGEISTGSTSERRARIVAAMRARGGQSRRYFTALAAALGYTITITEGSAFLFIIGTTTLPNPLFDPDIYWHWQVNVTGAASGADLEALFQDLKPAYTDVSFVYTP